MNRLARDYWTTKLVVPDKLPQGLDRVAHSLVGRYRRRTKILQAMTGVAQRISENSLSLQKLSDRRLREQLEGFREIFRRRGRGHEEALPEALAAISEAAYRTLGMRPYPVQILGAMVMHRGCLAEMATGEGKTLTACFPAILAGWTDRPCHIITVNDYLAGRDASEMKPLYTYCGVNVGAVTSEMSQEERRINYQPAVVYTTSKEILADFLRDRLRLGLYHHPSRRLLRELRMPSTVGREGLVMRGLDTAIIDEADSVLIDEAVTPLIISQAQENDYLLEACRIASPMAENLVAGTDYRMAPKYREIVLTPSGREKIRNLATSLPGLWQGTGRSEELVVQALTAKEYYLRDKQYVILEDKVVIVDEFTGRLMPNRTWRQGLHQAVEAREGLPMSKPSETLARLSFQRFFRFFRKLSGMTGTAREASGEFWNIYGLPVLSIPTHRPCQRIQFHDRVFAEQAPKWEAIVSEIMRYHDVGRPVLVGTRSVRASEKLAASLAGQGVPFDVLNAVKHKEEARIVAAAGEMGAITIATNMAGRGTDIKLGRGVAELGGLHVIASERHESGRIDRQLFGRCARQGDPGSCQAFISMDDELIERFAPASLKRLLSPTGEKKASADRFSAYAIAYAQRSAERFAFKQRREVLKMDTWLADALSFSSSGTDF